MGVGEERRRRRGVCACDAGGARDCIGIRVEANPKPTLDAKPDCKLDPKPGSKPDPTLRDVAGIRGVVLECRHGSERGGGDQWDDHSPRGASAH